jgi:hypothetical protein
MSEARTFLTFGEREIVTAEGRVYVADATRLEIVTGRFLGHAAIDGEMLIDVGNDVPRHLAPWRVVLEIECTADGIRVHRLQGFDVEASPA